MNRIRSIDGLESDFAELTAAASRLDALRLQTLRELDVAQVANADGARTMTEWVAGRLDLETSTAKTLVALARAEDQDLEAGLADGQVTTDRAAVVTNLRAAGADEATVAHSWAIRNRVLQRDGHRCVIAGCNSRTRLQPHHLIPYAQGGTHDLENLITVCWHHHHVVIHQQGRIIDPDSPRQRRTFLRTDPARAGP